MMDCNRLLRRLRDQLPNRRSNLGRPKTRWNTTAEQEVSVDKKLRILTYRRKRKD